MWLHTYIYICIDVSTSGYMCECVCLFKNLFCTNTLGDIHLSKDINQFLYIFINLLIYVCYLVSLHINSDIDSICV